MNPHLAYIKACALYYGTYRLWNVGDPQIRQHYMKVAMKDLVIALAVYNVERRKHENAR